MNEQSLAQQRALKSFQKMQYLRENVTASGGGGMDFNACGPPQWSRPAWEAFKQQYGHYPFGPQSDGGVIRPTTMAGAPDWVYELMGERKPPITVMPQ